MSDLIIYDTVNFIKNLKPKYKNKEQISIDYHIDTKQEQIYIDRKIDYSLFNFAIYINPSNYTENEICNKIFKEFCIKVGELSEDVDCEILEILLKMIGKLKKVIINKTYNKEVA